MTRHDCARCQWTPDLDSREPAHQQLAAHAQATDHWLCICCGQSLREHEQQTCERCLHQARTDLAGVVTMFEELPSLLGQMRARKAGVRSSEPPLMGGDVLAMLSNGSSGGRPRRLTSEEARRPERWWLKDAIGPLTLAEMMRVDRERTGREHQADNLPTDPQAVSQELGSWVLDWQETRGDHEPIGRTPSQIVSYAARYLQVHARWAANNHDAFADFAQDMRALHLRLERTTARLVTPGRASAECFECGGPLVEVLQEVTVTQKRDGRQITRNGPIHDEADGYRCRQCQAQYPPGRYNLALGEHLKTHAQWVPVSTAAKWAGVSVDQLKKWLKRPNGRVASRLTSQGARLVFWPDVRERINDDREEASA